MVVSLVSLTHHFLVCAVGQVLVAGISKIQLSNLPVWLVCLVFVALAVLMQVPLFAYLSRRTINVEQWNIRKPFKIAFALYLGAVVALTVLVCAVIIALKP
jgi:hypothetical protein